LVHLGELFKKFHKVKMNIHPKKCEFVVTSIMYLRHIILPNGIMAHSANDAPPSSLMDLTSSPKVKIKEGEGIGARL